MSVGENFDWRAHFDRNPNVMGGETVFKGTRVPLRVILASLAAGDTPEKLLGSFPSLSSDHIRATSCLNTRRASVR